MTSLFLLGDVSVWDESLEFNSIIAFHGKSADNIMIGLSGQKHYNRVFSGPAIMVPTAAALLETLSYTTYPQLITAAVKNISYRTSVIYDAPPSITHDLQAIMERFGVVLHCIVSRFRATDNHHTLVFLSHSYNGELMLSPNYPS